MASAARLSTIVAIALMAVVAKAPAQTGGGFEIPPSPSGQVSSAADSLAQRAREAAQSASNSMGLPDFTSGVGTRAGAPSTEPTAARDNSWLGNTSSQGPGRPSTAPFGGATPNSLRGGGSSIATVAATEDPASAEAQRRAQTQASAAARTGFASLPRGVSLPSRTTGNAPGTAAASPVFGPQTAEEARFDWSGYNTNTGGAATAAISPKLLAQQNIGTPGTSRNTSTTQAAATNGGTGGLGLPGSTNVATTSALPSNWTYKQIAQLGEYFGVQANDRRMSDPEFVNRLYSLWREDQQGKTASQTTGQTNSQSRTNQISPRLASQAGMTLGGSATADQSARMSLPGNLGAGNVAQTPGMGRPTVPGGFGQTSASTATSSQTRRPVGYFDSFGNPIDAEGNIIDKDGRPVDEATRYELTIGRKIREDMARIAREQAERERLAQENSVASPSDSARGMTAAGAIARRPPTGSAGSGSNRVIPSDPRLRPGAAGNPLASGRPPTEPLGEQDERSRSANHASLGGSVKAIGNSNPYVNIFLLCSLVANVFLFIWLQRLWYHHRDLIASSRVASSGITPSE